MSKTARIIVADDHSIVRFGLIQVLKELKPFATITEVSDYKALFEKINKEEFDLLILDIKMPNGNFMQAIELIKRKQPSLKILIFSSENEKLFATRFLKLGAHGFLHKLSPKEKIRDAINKMFESGKYISEGIKDSIIATTLDQKKPESSSVEALSDRELQVAKALANGATQKELAQELNLHPSTVSTYKSRVFEKLNVDSVPELIHIIELYK